jgi:hypothetical protein
MRVAEPQYVYAILDPASSSKDNIPSRRFGFLISDGPIEF